jgi:hydantoinase/carbamoylase family amidase
MRIDRDACASRIAHEINKLSAPPFTSGADGVTRYAFTEPYMLTLRYLSEQLRALGFTVKLDPVGNLIARNRPPSAAAIGLGSHCDSVRGGGSYDGALGVVAAIEVARLAHEQGCDLPLQIISWVEEEASGFGQLLLGSRLATGRIDERELRTEVRALDDGRPFFDHARDAGLEPERASEASGALDNLTAWIELHIEQGRVLEDAGEQLGVVEAIAGYVHADIEIFGQADHAGATPMGLRRDAAIVAAEFMLEVERLAIKDSHSRTYGLERVAGRWHSVSCGRRRWGAGRGPVGVQRREAIGASECAAQPRARGRDLSSRRLDVCHERA